MSVRIDESASRVLKRIGIDEPKILITIESTFCASCCGAYEEKSLRVRVFQRIENAADLILISNKPPIFTDDDALELIKSRGNHLIIHANLVGELYSDQ